VIWKGSYVGAIKIIRDVLGRWQSVTWHFLALKKSDFSTILSEKIIMTTRFGCIKDTFFHIWNLSLEDWKTDKVPKNCHVLYQCLEFSQSY